MAEAKIIFGNNQESGQQELAGASPIAINVLSDGKGAVRRRPGLATYDQAPSAVVDSTGINGLHVTAADTVLVSAESRKLYRIVASTAYGLSTTPAEEVAGGERPVFAENEVAVLVAGGDEIQKIDLTTFVSSQLKLTSTDAPPKATHVAANSSRFLANDLTSASTAGQLRYSKTGQVDYDEWPGRYLFTAEARPDPVRAIGENINEVWAWGTTTTQLFVPDASSVYAPSKTLSYGIGAPYSVIAVDQQFAWLDQRKRFMLSDGRSDQDLSQPIARTLRDITTFADCYGFRYANDQFDCIVFKLPSDGRTFCYQLGGGWSQWQGRSGSNWTAFPVTAHAHRPSDNTDVVGLEDGRVCQLTTAANDDLGEPIVADVTTGFINHDTDAIKTSKGLHLTLKRGPSASGDSEEMLISWRDDLGPFCDPIAIDLGSVTDREPVVHLWSLGTYRKRQYRLTSSGTSEWVLAGATETFEVGAN